MPATGGGTIYDIGYQHYEGDRLGRPYAIRSLVLHGLGAVWGINRGARARATPMMLAVILLFPAIVEAALGAFSGGADSVIDYATYFVTVQLFYVLFCAGQTPELVSADLRSRTLVLYLARALRRDDYVLGRLAALVGSLFLISATPLLIIFAGRVLADVDAWTAFTVEAPELAPIFGAAAVMAVMLGTISAALASLTPRRGTATALIVGFFLLTAALSEILRNSVNADWSWYLILLNPFFALSGALITLFGTVPPPNPMIAAAGLPAWTYGAACAGWTALGALVLTVRYRRIDP